MSGNAPTTLEEQVATVVQRVNGLLDGDESLSATQEKLKALKESVDGLEALNIAGVVEEIEKLRAAQELLVKQIRTSRKGVYVPGVEEEDFSVVKAMIGVRTGRWKDAGKEKEIMLEAARMKAGQTSGDDEAGGFFIPDQVIPEVIGAIYTRSAFIALDGNGDTRVSVLEGLTGGTVKIPKFDGGLIAYWIGEEDAYAASVADVGDVTMTPKKLGVLVRLTDSMVKLQGYGFERMIRNEMATACAKKLDFTVMYGRGGDNMPRGIAHMRDIKIFSNEQKTVYTRDQVEAASSPLGDWDGAELTFDTLSEMELALEEDDITLDSTHAWITSPRGINYLKRLRIPNFSGDTEGQYLVGVPYLSDTKLQDVVGHPFGKSTQIPSDNVPGETINGATDSTTEKYTDVVGGNLGNVVVGRWAGIEVDDDGGKGPGFLRDHLYIKLKIYADVQARQQRGLILCPDAQCRA